MRRRLPILASIWLATALLTAAISWDSSTVPDRTNTSVRPPVSIDESDSFAYVQGCVPILGDNGFACTRMPEVEWQTHLTALRMTLGMTETRFRDWQRTHVAFPRARSASPGSVSSAVAALSRYSDRVFLIGHSAGGAAIANYLLTLRDQGRPQSALSGAYLLDAPIMPSSIIQSIAAREAGFNNSGRLAGLGEWAKVNRIDVVVVSYADDWAVNSVYPVADLPFLLMPSNPRYARPWDLIPKHNYLVTDPSGAYAVYARLFTSDRPNSYFHGRTRN